MKIFISCPFSGILDEKTKLVKEEYKYFFEELKAFLDENKIDYYCAIIRENWGKDYISSVESTESDFKGIVQSDSIFVIPGNPISGGVHVELGWASSLKKKMYLFIEKNAKYSPVVMGLSALCDVQYHETGPFPSRELLNNMIDEISKEILR